MNNVPNSAAAGCLLTFQAESLAPCTILTAQLPFPKPTLTKNQLNMSHKYMLHRINRYNCVLKTVSNGKVLKTMVDKMDTVGPFFKFQYTKNAASSPIAEI